MSVDVMGGTGDLVTGSREKAARALEHEVATLIRRVRRVIAQRARAVDRRLQPASYLILAWLVDAGPVRASAIVEAMHIDKAVVSRHLRRLVELGFVQRTPDPQDGRATLVTASDAAVHRLRTASLDHQRWLDDRLGSWSTADLDRFVGLLSRYSASSSPRTSGAQVLRREPSC